MADQQDVGVATDPRRKRAKILQIAQREFVNRGLAGGRTAYICREAGVNHQAIAAYFGTKEDLFDAVVDDQVHTLFRSLPIDPQDLATSAGELLVHLVARPDWVRLERWRVLERPTPTTSQRRAAEVTARAVADALSLPPDSARELLTLVTRLVYAWAPDTHDGPPPTADQTAQLRTTVEAATAELVRATTSVRP